jgi:hypothetical protein
MECRHLRKTLLYAVAALVLGILLTLAPLIALTMIETGEYRAEMGAFANSMNKLENIDGFNVEGYNPDPRVFVFSFAVAIAAYALFKFRIVRQKA